MDAIESIKKRMSIRAFKPGAKFAEEKYIFFSAGPREITRIFLASLA